MGTYRMTCLMALMLALSAAGDVVRSGSNVDPRPGPAGEAPYEMIGRQEERDPLVTFEDCSQWEVEARNCEARLYRTAERKLYRGHCGKLVYRGTGPNPLMLVRLKRPVTIPSAWDCVNFWNWGNCWSWNPRADTPALSVSAVVAGADGREHLLPLGSMCYQYWFLAHRKVQERIARPARFIGFRFSGGTNAADRVVYLGPVYFYKEALKPLVFEPWPERLPFPVGKNGILPMNKTGDFRNTVRHSASETVFTYVGSDCQLSYRYRPQTGTLGDVSVLYQGRETFPCQAGGLVLGGAEPASAAVSRRLLAQRLDGDALVTDWRFAWGGQEETVRYRFRMVQKSLTVEMSSSSGMVESVDLGHASPVRSGKLFWIPYLTFGHKDRDPRVLYADGLFYFTQFDWYHSDATSLFARHGLKPLVRYNGGARYDRKTDGTRNALRERLTINVSPDFWEVLPTIPNPPSPMRDVQGDRQWRIRNGDDIEGEIADARRLRRLGLERATVRYHEDSWRDGGESFTFRLEAAPKRGGDPALRHLIASVQDCGWLVGAYTNYTDYAPVNRHWDEDWVTRTASGEWLGAWTRCYAPKPMISVQMEARLAPELKRRFGMDHSYCDVHTAVTPFSRVDFDARVPGAGTFRRTFECFGRLLHNEKSAYGGPVYSEGGNHWWYAGLTDGNYAQLKSSDPPQEPLLVDFDLLKIHPLEMDAGMGAPYMFFRSGHGRNYNQYLATTLAYGHIGMLEGSEREMMKMYYMLQPLQRHYVMVPVRRIAYGRGTELLDTSQALIAGAHREGRVHVEYESGMKVWVNGGDKPWKPGGTSPVDAELPAWGYLATTPRGDTFCYSGMVRAGGLRETHGSMRFVDLAHGPTSHYLDTRGAFVKGGTMAGQGAAVLRYESRGSAGWELIPAREFSCMGFDPALMGSTGLPEVTAVDAQGKPLGPATVRWSRGLLYVLRRDASAFKYVLKPSGRALPPKLGCKESPYAIPGEDISVALPPAWDLAGDRVFWCAPGGEIPMEVLRQGSALRVRVPESLPLDALVWLRIPSVRHPQEERTSLWLDFLTLPAYDMEFQALRDSVPQGEGIPLRVTVSSNLTRPGRGQLTLACTGGELGRSEFKLAMPGHGRQTIDTVLSIPSQGASLLLEGKVTEGGVRGFRQRRLTAEPAHVLQTDLTQVPWAAGYCLRGQKEVESLGGVYDGSFEIRPVASGGVTRPAMFTHPPWGQEGTGYVFGATTLTLPVEPSLLHWHLGRSDGTFPGDGLTFRVEVVSDGKAREVFRRHYGAFAWSAASVDLSAYAGRKITLRLIADCGPRDDHESDHGAWGEPRIVSRERRMCVSLSALSD